MRADTNQYDTTSPRNSKQLSAPHQCRRHFCQNPRSCQAIDLVNLLRRWSGPPAEAAPGFISVMTPAVNARLRFTSWVAAEVLSLRTACGTPPRVQRAACNPCCKAPCDGVTFSQRIPADPNERAVRCVGSLASAYHRSGPDQPRPLARSAGPSCRRHGGGSGPHPWP